MNAQRYMLQSAAADRLLGQMLDRLEQQDVTDRAMVVVVADHGQTLPVRRDVRAQNGPDREPRRRAAGPDVREVPGPDRGQGR